LLLFKYFSWVKKVARKSPIFLEISLLTKEEEDRTENREIFSLINISDFLV
tara:strand:- start:32 stop:184 length:153 start_codon:yes stop_codon:yes gene_type:complete